MKILLVDDHALIRDAMVGVLREIERAATILEAKNGREAEELIVDNPDVSLVLLDRKLPDRDGLEMLSDLRKEHPAVAVVMLSAFCERENVLKALDAGAQGFIGKTATRDVLVGALRLVLAGGVYIPPEVLARSTDQATASPRPCGTNPVPSRRTSA